MRKGSRRLSGWYRIPPGVVRVSAGSRFLDLPASPPQICSGPCASENQNHKASSQKPMETAPFHCGSGIASLNTKVVIVQIADNERKGSADPLIPLTVRLSMWTMRVSRLTRSKKVSRAW